MSFPSKLFDASGDPAFDALDFGISGQVLSCGNSFLMQGLHAGGMAFTNKGPLCCVHRGIERIPVAHLWTSDLLPRKRMSGQLRRSTVSESDLEMEKSGQDEQRNEEQVYSLRYTENGMGNCLDTFTLDEEDVLVAHVDVAQSDLKVSRLESPQGLEPMRLRPLHELQVVDEDPTSNFGGGEILQLATALSSEDKLLSDQRGLFATRRSRCVDFVTCEVRREEDQICLLRKHKVCYKLENREKRKNEATCCVSFNPFWQEEACVLNTDGTVDIWDASSESVVGYSGMGKDAMAAAVLEHSISSRDAVAFVRKLVLPFGHCVWGAHPRTILCCQPYRISLVDLRSSSSCHDLLQMPSHVLGLTGRLFSLCRGGGDVRSSHQFIVSSSSLLCIFDIRQPSMPLLRWLHHQEFDPPRHLLRLQLESRSVEEANLLVTGSHQSGEILCYQYGKFAGDAAPSSLGLPQKLFSIGDANLEIPSRSLGGRPGEERRRVEQRKASEKQELRDLRTLRGLSFSWQPSSSSSSSQPSVSPFSARFALVFQSTQFGEVFVQKVAAQPESEEEFEGNCSWTQDSGVTESTGAHVLSRQHKEADRVPGPEGYAGDDEEGARERPSLSDAYHKALRVMVSTMKKEDVALSRQGRAKALRTMNLKKENFSISYSSPPFPPSLVFPVPFSLYLFLIACRMVPAPLLLRLV
eukprot:259048-Hanusia_phi.AAC.3